MDKSEWMWMPHPGHFILSSECRFHLNTWVGLYIVSTVGELLLPDSQNFDDIGFDRKYETIVFKALPKFEDSCCPYRADRTEVDMFGYNDPVEAYKGHLSLCQKWSNENA